MKQSSNSVQFPCVTFKAEFSPFQQISKTADIPRRKLTRGDMNIEANCRLIAYHLDSSKLQHTLAFNKIIVDEA